ncbi:hypothetical protein SCP_0204890 [Sparassis crispa]|uniref:Uncharacterized protein n=1 Tax=Sparassis crispa TaxID=139825 RepID=A0A401GAX1_9APHY|nr:hypothetical protein SCP_0204890 [Sparassis crispa]GBE79291.1 hypothetical protein SCP_0204890 [Sparassis crispa]
MSGKPEDAQPNEFRLARKGATSVPTIRASRPPTVRGSFRGNARGLNRGGMHTSRPVPRVDAYQHRPNHSQLSGHIHGATRPPQTSQDSLPRDCLKRPLTVQDSERSSKRPRLELAHPPVNHQIFTHSGSANRKSAPRKRKRKEEVVVILVDMPEHCKKGAPGSHQSRRGWLRSQIGDLESTKGVKVVQQSFQGSAVRFECRPNGPRGESTPGPSPNGSDNEEHPSISDVSGNARKDIAAEEPSVFKLRPYSAPSVRGEKVPSQLLQDAPGGPPGATQNEYPSASTTVTQGNFILVNAPSSERHLMHGRVLCSEDTDGIDQSLHDSRKELPLESSPVRPLAVSDRSAIHRADSPFVYDLTSSEYLHGEDSTSAILCHTTSESPNHPLAYSFRSGSLTISPSSNHLEQDESCSEPLRQTSLRPSVESHGWAARSPHNSPPTCHDRRPSISRDHPPFDNQQSFPQSNDNFRSPSLSREEHPSCPSNSNDGLSTSALNSKVLGDASLHVETANETIQFQRDSYAKPRRLLTSSTFGVFNVTVRGSLDLVGRSLPRKTSTLLSGLNTPKPIVDDVCLLNLSHSDLIVMGHARDAQQVSLVEVTNHNVREVGSFDRPLQAERKGGVSVVCSMMQPRMFATGGYDHMVHLWTVPEDIAQTSAPTPLAIKHSSIVQSLLPIRDTSHKLVSAGADCNVHIWDLSSERVVNTLKTSNSVYHAHQALSPYCTLLEVAHRELQFEIRDHRWVPKTPVQRFGYHIVKLHGRYTRGDMRYNTFACGDREGSVRLWDLRNLRRTLDIIPCFSSSGRRIIQVAFDNNHLIVSSEDHQLAFMQHSGGSAVGCSSTQQSSMPAP